MNVVIIGASGHGKVVRDILQLDLSVKIAGFIDDDKNSHNTLIDGIPVLGDIDSLKPFISEYQLEAAVIAIGDNRTRAILSVDLKNLGLKRKNAIHPDALIAKDVSIGEGVVIAAGVVINPATRIGDYAIINTGVILEYGSVVEDYAHISPGVAVGGLVTVNKYAHVGIGVTINDNLTIGENVTVGAGAVVVTDIPDNTIAIGVPARVVRHKELAEGV
ncbi:acetyltransferase [Chloroflexota bacterium]